MSFPYFPKQEPIKSIFKQTSEDEDQKLEGSPEFTVLMKGYRTRSCIYERILPDNVSSALRINGPRGSNGCMIYNQLGQIKIKTGLKTKQAGSGLFGLKTSGQQQLHHGRSNIQYNAGGKEDEGQALNVLAYGDVVEESVGGTRYIKATKILIRATDTLVLRGNNVNIEAQGEYSVAAGQIVTGTINDKEIITGQKMTIGAPEETTMKFDPRAQVNIISPGNINHKILGDYKLKSFGCISLFALGGFGTLVKNRSVGMSISTKTKFAAGGTAEWNRHPRDFEWTMNHGCSVSASPRTAHRLRAKRLSMQAAKPTRLRMTCETSVCTRRELLDFTFAFARFSGAFPDFKLDVIDLGFDLFADGKHPRTFDAYPAFNPLRSQSGIGGGHHQFIASPRLYLMET